ncbi:tumor necrosis factor a (TNF superfamily, member 2) [Triplophysa rosa]|uniref:Lymphotoxin-alpha n=1 Tax=Triplophysa rosa TaxID=992332 RepID=A0A9W7WG55_TRIRA|nr:tumor necrosis factor a (TNF superfamily, member 2) [Triplophysa rosa]KAI7798481.1 TNF-alpha [Triplophysa rosa]
MGHESEVLLDIEQLLPQVRRSGSSKSGIWRMCGALLAVALCAAAAVCFTFNKSPDSQDDGSNLRHMLRAVPQNANNTVKDAIHLTAGDFKGISLEWKDNQDQAFFQGGLKLVKNEIIIPNDGIYFIYSQVSFRVTCKSNPEEVQEIVHVSHEVMRYSDSYSDSKADSKPLFSALRSACVQVPDSEQSWYSTIYFGAAFRMNAGDRLFTVTSPPSKFTEVEEEQGKNFFGAFAL